MWNQILCIFLHKCIPLSSTECMHMWTINRIYFIVHRICLLPISSKLSLCAYIMSGWVLLELKNRRIWDCLARPNGKLFVSNTSHDFRLQFSWLSNLKAIFPQIIVILIESGWQNVAQVYVLCSFVSHSLTLCVKSLSNGPQIDGRLSSGTRL